MIGIGKRRVLLVEDNELDRRAMLRQLAAVDDIEFDVVTVDRLDSALDAVESADFDCVLLDLSLPDSVGLDSVDALLDRNAHAPVVVLTGLDDPTVAVAAVKRGAQDYLTKHDLTGATIARSIDYAIARHASERQLQLAHERLSILEDRERIARDLHDNVIQQLFAAGMSVQAAAARSADPDVAERLLQAVDGIDAGIHQLREAIFELHAGNTSVTFSDEIIAVVESQHDALGFEPSVHLGRDLEHVDAAVRHAVLAALREGLSNVAKHAEATVARVAIDVHGPDIVVAVTDNGIGPPKPGERSSEDLTGVGIKSLTERAAALRGSVSIGLAPGGGTELVWRAPIDATTGTTT